MGSTKPEKKLLVCNCNGTMPLDDMKLSTLLGRSSEPFVNSALCRAQIGNYRAALEKGQPMLVACTQEAPLFQEIAHENGEEDAVDVSFFNIRELAGWSDEAGQAGPKLAALVKAAELDVEPTRLMTLRSSGNCLVYGSGQIAYDTALKLSQRLGVTLVLSDADDLMLPDINLFPIMSGKIDRIKGALGRFEVSFSNYAAAVPSSRQDLAFEERAEQAEMECDLIFDLSGGQSLISAPVPRDGYFRAAPDQDSELARVMFEIVDYVGEFEKPLYVNYEQGICAHGRSGKTGCNKCIDHCPASAISHAGDFVLVDGAICGGCGNCSASCPTGAIEYSYPRLGDLVTRIQTLVSSYLSAKGKNPVVLFCDETHGLPLIGAMARYGRGLPANILPVLLHSAISPGHETLLAAFGAGASHVHVLVPPSRKDELSALNEQVDLCNTVLEQLDFVASPDGGLKVQILVEEDPDKVEAALYDTPVRNSAGAHLFSAAGGKRDIAHMAFASLYEASSQANELMELPAGSPYGRISVDSASCTLCLSCVGSCPAGALLDGQDHPQLRFHERNCVQCGLCRATCPENAITLEARYNFSDKVQTSIILNEDEPFDCIRCKKPFGSARAIEKVSSILKDKNPMFQTSAQLDLLKMCDDCRVIAQTELTDNPMALGEVPRVRTTEDYINGGGNSDGENS